MLCYRKLGSWGVWRTLLHVLTLALDSPTIDTCVYTVAVLIQKEESEANNAFGFSSSQSIAPNVISIAVTKGRADMAMAEEIYESVFTAPAWNHSYRGCQDLSH